MRIDYHVSPSDVRKFERYCELAIRNVGYGTKSATTEAAVEIFLASQEQVPVATGTLKGSGFVGVSRRTDTKNYRYGAVIGYGDLGSIAGTAELGEIQWIQGPTESINPVTGERAREYANKVHEDLAVYHGNGKAKFLEDPANEWASGRYARTATEYWKAAIDATNGGSTMKQIGTRTLEDRRKR